MLDYILKATCFLRTFSKTDNHDQALQIVRLKKAQYLTSKEIVISGFALAWQGPTIIEQRPKCVSWMPP